MIAVSENQFELFEHKKYQFRFLERCTHEYDLEVTDGQMVYPYRRTDK